MPIPIPEMLDIFKESWDKHCTSVLSDAGWSQTPTGAWVDHECNFYTSTTDALDAYWQQQNSIDSNPGS